MVQHFVRIVPNTSANSDPLKPLIGIIWLVMPTAPVRDELLAA